jgi:hypothetical protein
MGGTGAVPANDRRATEARHEAEDEVRLEELRRWRNGQRRVPSRSAALITVMNYNKDTADAAEREAAAREAAAVAATTNKGGKRRLTSPHKSAGRRGVGTGEDGRRRTTKGGAAQEIMLPMPSNGLEFTPPSAVKIMSETRKPGPLVKVMVAQRLVPVEYKAMMKLKEKAKDPAFKVP